jgi:formylglycine-generating enzyme required for sulfatase activity
MNDISARLARLRHKLTATNDPEDRADLEAAIVALEEKAGLSPLKGAEPSPEPAALEPARNTEGDTINVGDLTSATGVAVGAGARATVYIDGRRNRTSGELIAVYLKRLIRRCEKIPLQGINEQYDVVDTLNVDLDKVYTQLIVRQDVAERERFDPDVLATMDVAAFVVAHRGSHLLPHDQRTQIRYTPLDMTASRNVRRIEDLYADGEPGPTKTLMIDSLQPGDIEVLVHQGVTLSFYGPKPITLAIASQQRLVILGEPGSGKSTALRYLALKLAVCGLDRNADPAQVFEGWGLGRLLPVLVPVLSLARYLADHPDRRGSGTDLWNYLAETLELSGANAGLAAAVHEELESGRMILLVDGLDEVAATDARIRVVRAVSDFADLYPTCRIVVTSRTRAYEGDYNKKWQLPGWPSVTLADWEYAQMRAFIEAWYAATGSLHHRSSGWITERSSALLHALLRSEEMFRLARQPLMLTIMALVHLNDSRLPVERVTLISRCIDILLGRWELAKEETEYKDLMSYIGLGDLAPSALRPLLARAASAAHAAARPGELGRLSRAVLRTLVDDELKSRGHLNPSWGADRFLDYTDIRAGLIQANDAGDDYSFPHQTFQEYLVGLALVDGTDTVARLLARRNDDRWRTAIILGTAHLALSSVDVPYRFLSRLIEEPDRNAAQYAFDLQLAGEIGTEIGWTPLVQREPLFGTLRKRLAEALVALADRETLEVDERIRIGLALGEIGDPRFDPLLPPLVTIGGGPFVVGAITPGFDDEGPPQSIDVPTFRIGVYPVTNGEYRRFLRDMPDQPHPHYWEDLRFNNLSLPVVGITWYDATAYCDWLTRRLSAEDLLPPDTIVRLPLEEEWEKAAVWNPEHLYKRVYPWGDTWEGTRVNTAEGRRKWLTTPAGCFPGGVSPYGVQDMIGNVWEWTASKYSRDVRSRPNDPQIEHYVLRGSSCVSLSTNARATYRGSRLPPHYWRYHLGFRIVLGRPFSTL